MITIDNKRLHDYIVDKDKLVSEGRKISQDIENLEFKIKHFEDKEKKITGKIIPPKELTDRGDAVAEQIARLSDELDKIAKEINDSKLAAVPADMKADHLKLLKDKEVLERERNKIALKVQKIKDKVVPIIQKEVKPLLGEYDDIETAKTKDGKIVITTFNYLEDFKRKFRR
jgi:predicted  nucleic acid-binding Zn-ribbon protein